MAGAFPLLIGTDAMAQLGPPPPALPSMGPRPGGFIPPSVAEGGFRGGPDIGPRPGFGGGPGISRPPNFSRAPEFSKPPNFSRPQNTSRPSFSQMGGLAPNSKIAGSANRGPQFSPKIQPHPKGSGSVLPSIAQGKNLRAAGEHTGFPSVSGKGGGELANRAQGATANQQFWNDWSKQNEGKLANFQASRTKDWNNINEFRKTQNVAAGYNKPEWNNYKNNVQDFRSNRAIEIQNNFQNNFDNYSNAQRWSDRRWYSGRDYAGRYRDYSGKYSDYYDKYWNYAEKYWWGAATYATAATWLALDETYDRSGNYDYGSSGNYDYGRSRSYDYGVNVVYEGDDVYVDGKRAASAEEYSQQAITLANTSKEQPSTPMPPEDRKQAEYLPLGVWAMVQEEKGDAYMFFQIAVDKNGVVTGAFKNLLSGEASPIFGQVDKKTQRIAWKIGSNNTVIEAGLQNLSQDAASCLVHFGTDTTQTWLLVRLKNPAMPSTPPSGPVANDSR